MTIINPLNFTEMLSIFFLDMPHSMLFMFSYLIEYIFIVETNNFKRFPDLE